MQLQVVDMAALEWIVAVGMVVGVAVDMAVQPHIEVGRNLEFVPELVPALREEPVLRRSLAPDPGTRPIEHC